MKLLAALLAGNVVAVAVIFMREATVRLSVPQSFRGSRPP